MPTFPKRVLKKRTPPVPDLVRWSLGGGRNPDSHWSILRIRIEKTECRGLTWGRSQKLVLTSCLTPSVWRCQENLPGTVKKALFYSELLVLRRPHQDLKCLVSRWSFWESPLWLRGGVNSNPRRRCDVDHVPHIRGGQRCGGGLEEEDGVKLRYLIPVMTTSRMSSKSTYATWICFSDEGKLTQQ